MGGKILKSFFSQITNQLHFDKQLLHNFTLDTNIMIHNTTNMPAKSGCGLINAEALLGGYTWRHVQCTMLLCPKTKRIIIQNWQCSKWCMVETHITESSSSSWGNVSSPSKTLLLRCPIVFGLPQKGLVLIYTFVNPFTTSFRPPGPRLSHKNVCSFISRSSKRTPNQFNLLTYILCLAFLT